MNARDMVMAAHNERELGILATALADIRPQQPWPQQQPALPPEEPAVPAYVRNNARWPLPHGRKP